MSRKTVLVVEDDASIREGILDALAFDGYETLFAATAADARQAALERHYDLLLLDLVLPGGDGFDILAAVREAHDSVPVIVLTARGEEDDRVRGLRLGADDYVVKPFSVKELLARVEAVLRRSAERTARAPSLRLDGAVVDFGRREIRHDDGEATELSEREADLLAYLARHPGRPVSREELLTRVWRIDARHLETRSVDMHVARLREKLRDDSKAPRVLATVRGQGYAFVAASNGAGGGAA